MEKVDYQLTTLSSVIVSPRDSLAFYEASGDFSGVTIVDGDKQVEIKQIYPFYRYGVYEEYAPNRAEYYLPGSSVKGALRQGRTERLDVMVDDVKVPGGEIVLRNLKKAQYLTETNKACFDTFFPQIGVEMLKAGTSLQGDAYFGTGLSPNSVLKDAHKITRFKIEQMLAYLSDLGQRNYDNKGLKHLLTRVSTRLADLLGDDSVLIIGGYKGLLHSIRVDDEVVKKMLNDVDKKEKPSVMHSAVFIDPDTDLPHGLVKLNF